MAVPIPRPQPTLEGLPIEIISMIMGASRLHTRDVEFNIDEGKIPVHKSKPILETTDIFSIWLTSRLLEAKALDAFGKRFFTIRNHMLSRQSVQCLVNISRSAKLRNCVKKVAFGPERINSELQDQVENNDFKRLPYDIHNPKVCDPESEKTWRVLVEDQKAFDGAECVAQIKTAMTNLPRLQHIRLDSSLTNDAKSWKTI